MRRVTGSVHDIGDKPVRMWCGATMPGILDKKDKTLSSLALRAPDRLVSAKRHRVQRDIAKTAARTARPEPAHEKEGPPEKSPPSSRSCGRNWLLAIRRRATCIFVLSSTI